MNDIRPNKPLNCVGDEILAYMVKVTVKRTI